MARPRIGVEDAPMTPGSVALPQQQGVSVGVPFELILEDGMIATVYAEQRRIVLKTSLVRSWFMGAA